MHFLSRAAGAARRGRRVAGPTVRTALVIALALVARAPSAGAGSVVGESGAGGVTITIVRWEGRDRVHAAGVGADDHCAYGLDLGPPGFVPDLDTVGPRPPDARLAILTCDGSAVGLVWVGPHNTVDLAEAARAAAERWVQTVPVPSPAVGVSPPDAGLVGVESWFWIEGGPRGPVTDSVQAFGVAVDVRMVPSAVSWSFGDGATVVAGPGRRWPVRSDVRHAYDRGGPMTVTAAQTLDPAYRVVGSDWLALPPIDLTTAHTHEVREAQARLVG